MDGDLGTRVGEQIWKMRVRRHQNKKMNGIDLNGGWFHDERLEERRRGRCRDDWVLLAAQNLRMKLVI